MNQENLDYLLDQLKNTGFGEEWKAQLTEQLTKSQTEFQLQYATKFSKDDVVATLYFSGSKDSDRYFFNRYDLAVKHPENMDVNKQTFYIAVKGSSITLKEGYNLMEGRAVYKRGLVYRDKESKEETKYNAWRQLNPNDTDKYGNLKIKEYNDKYNFDVAKVLAHERYSVIKELGDETQCKTIVDSLNKGNKHYVTLVDKETQAEVKHWIQANPAKRMIDVYDTKMQLVILLSEREKQKQEQGAKKDNNESLSQGKDVEGDPKKNNARSRNTGPKVTP